MLLESRTFEVSASASVSSETSLDGAGENFTVADLPLPEGAAKTGMLILRNESLFPGMVGISLPLKGNLWVREDGTFNLSGFFRRQIPKFKLGMFMAAKADMTQNLDVYHAVYRPVVENALSRQQFQVIRTVLEAGLGYYKEDGPARRDLLELRSRVMKLRARSSSSGSARDSIDPTAPAAPVSPPKTVQELTTEEVMETRRRISDSKLEEKDGARRTSLTSGESDEVTEAADADTSRSSRAESGQERKLKIAQQVVGGDAPKQKGPFRLWKSKTGEESYDKTEPS
eukprot:g6481.t1